MKALKIGISGVRGVVGETFTPELVVDFAQAFGTYLDSGRILVCRDTRPSGSMVVSAVIAGLLASGCEVLELGVCPTPTMQLAIPWLQAQGGVSITAGHNPAEWNALKFARSDGLYLNTAQAEELLDVYHQGEFTGATWNRIRAKSECRDAIGHHVEMLKRNFNIEAIRSRRLRVAVDCCNGACSLLSANWLEALGCDVLAINDDPGSPFPHDPEPRIDTTAQVRALVRASQADIGFVHDADGERLGIVDESGRPFSEELTLALAATIKLREKVGPVVTNVSTTRAVDRIASQYGARVIRTPVGQSYISEAILENEAVIGGEGNGAVAVPEVLASHDAAAAMGLILEYLAKLEQPVSALVEQVPRLTMSKQQVPVEPSLIFSVLRNFRDAIQGNTSGGVMDLTDGVKIEWPDGWVHVRASNTESLIRIIVESESASRTSALVDWAREHLRS